MIGINSKLACVLLFVVGLIAYSSIITGQFVWDDELLVVSNRYIQELHKIPVLFTTHIAAGGGEESNLYRPLQMASYALDYAIWGLDARAYHVTNLILHILVALGIYRLMQLLFVGKNLAAFVAAVLFVAHPIHTEAVSYIAGRADLLACLFMLFATICYINYARKRKTHFYALSIVAYLFALLSKEVAVVLPLLLISYDWIYRSEGTAKFKRHLPYLALTLIYVTLRLTIFNFPITKTIVDQYTIFERIPVVFQPLALYLSKLFIPLDLHMEYKVAIVPILDFSVLLGMLIILALAICIFAFRKKQKAISFSLSWIFINYLPVSNIYPVNAFFAEHWSYIFSIGLFMLVGYLTLEVCKIKKPLGYIVSLLLVLLLTASSYLTFKQNQYWKSPEHFYRRTLQYAPTSHRVHYRLGLLYLRQGRIEEGIEKNKQALAIRPDFILAYENLSSAYLVQGKAQLAIETAQRALELDESSEIIYNNLGVGYVLIDDEEKAITLFKQAVEIKPDYAAAHDNLAKSYYMQGEHELAVIHCNWAISLGLEIQPEFLEQIRRLQ